MNLQWKHILILAFSAVLAELAFAPFNQFYTAFFALVPLLYILDRCKNGFLTGFIWGFFYSLFSIHWLAFNTGTYWWVATFSMLLASVFLALNYAVIGFFFTWIRKRDSSFAFFLFPFIWVAVEFLRSFGTLGFPWLALGHSQAYNTLYVQTADIGGVYTVSFLLLLTNLFLYLLLRSYSRQRLTALLLIIMIPYLYGTVAINTDMQSGEKLNFRIIQPNIGGKEKWEPANRVTIMNKMDSLSRAETGIAPDVIVWPETAVPFYLRSSRYYKNIILRCARDMQSTIITGSLDYFFPDTVSRYSSTNSIFIFEPGVNNYQNTVYDKIHLVPFGEFTRAVNILPG
ncbi:MAG: apolipoprotein N-acyltransferase [Candidatus Marinimicrobia bacterium]|nr:apolipoprotein N-acyltransferase [Candidatus Neomarinimicrobiota bacterium]